jgi:hypothetical protein
MSDSHSGFTKVVNTNVQTSTILNGVAGALSSISSTPGFTGYTIIKPQSADIVLSDNTLQTISSSKVLLLDGTSLTENVRLDLGGDTIDNAKRLIKIFGLDVNPNPKLITVVKAGTGANAAKMIYLSNGSTTNSKTYVLIDLASTGANYYHVLAENDATQTGYFSVSLGNIENSILFNIVARQV